MNWKINEKYEINMNFSNYSTDIKPIIIPKFNQYNNKY